MGKGKEERVDELLEMADLMKEKYAHPYDLSGCAAADGSFGQGIACRPRDFAAR